MVAVKDVNEGQELTYDYGVRSEAKGVGDFRRDKRGRWR
jgi:hypothetical protein